MSDDSDEVLGMLSGTTGPDRWLRLAGIMSAAQLESFLDGQLNIMILFEYEFKRRFPREHAAWNVKHELE